jgi:beta-fructofuranosidase
MVAIAISMAVLFSIVVSCALAETCAPVDYRLYPAPEGGYVGDTMPFVTGDGTLELYYLYDTDHNGQGYHPIYRFTTDDFIGYEDDGMMLEYGLMSDPDPALGTGSVLRDRDGLYHLFYTGHNDTGNGGQGKECVMHATSEDRAHWEKQPEDTFFSPDGYSRDDFRDPEVFWMEAEERYWMLIAAREAKLGGVVAKYTSPDLKAWTFEGPIYTPQTHYMLECPDLFRMGDTWYLTYSWDCVTYYAIGESINGPFAAPEDNILDGQGLMEGNGFVFYAAKTAEWNGNTYLCGWLGRAGLSADSGIYQWAGNVLNHQLVQREDGTLGVKAPESFEDYFTQELTFEAGNVEGKTDIEGNTVVLSAGEGGIALADMGVRAPTMRLECDVTLGADGCAGFAFGGSAAEEAWTALCLDAGRNLLHYEGYELTELDDYPPMAVTRFDFSENQRHHVTLVCENEIVVLYIDDQKALSSRIGHSTDGAHIGVFASDCDAVFSNITMKIPKI